MSTQLYASSFARGSIVYNTRYNGSWLFTILVGVPQALGMEFGKGLLMENTKHFIVNSFWLKKPLRKLFLIIRNIPYHQHHHLHSAISECGALQRARWKVHSCSYNQSCKVQSCSCSILQSWYIDHETKGKGEEMKAGVCRGNLCCFLNWTVVTKIRNLMLFIICWLYYSGKHTIIYNEDTMYSIVLPQTIKRITGHG